MSFLLWPFKKIYQLEQKIIDLLCIPFKFFNNNNHKNDGPIVLVDFESTNEVKNKVKKRFKYVIKNQDNKMLKGTFDAFSKVDVHSFLLSQGFEVYKIEEDKFANILGLAQVKSKIKLRPKTLAFFLTQLSTYLKSGITLVDSIKILSRQTKKNSERKLYQKIVYELNTGVSFSEAMIRQGDAFPKLLINMIKTAEMTGQLSSTLDDMADYYTSVDVTRKQIISALTYPTAIFFLALAVVTFMILYVVPQFEGIYTQANAKLPSITLFVLGVSAYMQENIIMIALFLVATISLLVLSYHHIKPFRSFIQWFAMHLPVIRNVIIYNEVIMFTKTFASLINHDVFITDSLEILGKITNNEIYKKLINNSINDLSNGKELSLAFKNNWAFPDTAYEMLSTGERTGKMGEMMENVSKYYQEQQKTLVTQLKSLIEPVMIVILAILVGLIVLSIVIPMFDMYKQID